MRLEMELDDPDATVITLTEAEFIAANGEDDECMAALAAIKSGAETEVPLGGGAMPITILRKAREQQCNE